MLTRGRCWQCNRRFVIRIRYGASEDSYADGLTNCGEEKDRPTAQAIDQRDRDQCRQSVFEPIEACQQQAQVAGHMENILEYDRATLVKQLLLVSSSSVRG